MKILLTVHQFFPDFFSGTEVLTLSVSRELVAQGHDVRVFAGNPSAEVLGDGERFDEYEFEGIQVYRFRHSYTPMGGQNSLIEVGYDNLLAAVFFEKILKNFSPDVIHFFHLNRLGTRLIEVANKLGVSAFMTLTDFWMVCPTGQLMLPDGSLCSGPNEYAGNCIKHYAQSAQKSAVGSLAKWIPVPFVNLVSILTGRGLLGPYPQRIEVDAMRGRLITNIGRLNQLRKILVPTQFMRSILVEHGVRPALIVDSTYGLNVNNDVSKPKEFRLPLRIGYIGTLAPHKGCHVLIEAFKALPEGCALLSIYGSRDDFPEYANELAERAAGYEHIDFCGTFANEEIFKVLSEIDVLVVPSTWYENTPLVIHSAQAAFCPVVASDFPGISAIISDECNGLLFKPGSVDELTAALDKLIKEPMWVPKLSSNSRPPKPIPVYVKELLAFWGEGN